MSSKNTENKQSPQELVDEELKSVAGGKQDPLTDPNPPAEVPSPSERSLDPNSASQPSNY